MPLLPTAPKIYHITHGANLSRIVDDACLWSDEERLSRHLESTIVGMSEIKQRRLEQRVVQCHPDTTVGQYVPFYFCPRAPMLGAIHVGRVKGVEGGQRAILHLVTDLTAVSGSDLEYVFSNGHAAMRFSEFFDDLADLDGLDWERIASDDWRDTPDDNDRKRRKQAEFLVHGFFPWRLVSEIGVFDSRVQERVVEILGKTEHKPPVNVRRMWYY